MSFSYNVDGPGNDGWFRVSKVEVTTTVFVTALAAISVVLFAIYPPIAGVMALDPGAVATGQVWRIVTWPLANAVSLWTVLAIFIFWYFGSDLERQVGRGRFTRLIVGYIFALSAIALLVGLLSVPGFLAGINTLELMVLLTWIAEYPTRRFMFNIPAWAFGAVIVGLQILGLMAARDAFGLLSLLLGLLACAMIARSVGLLSEQKWVPGLPQRSRKPRQAKQSRQPRRTRRGKSRGKGSTKTVVTGPWETPTSSSPQAQDAARLDELLDRISESGWDGLSDQEKSELNMLRERRGR